MCMIFLSNIRDNIFSLFYWDSKFIIGNSAKKKKGSYLIIGTTLFISPNYKTFEDISTILRLLVKKNVELKDFWGHKYYYVAIKCRFQLRKLYI